MTFFSHFSHHLGSNRITHADQVTPGSIELSSSSLHKLGAVSRIHTTVTVSTIFHPSADADIDTRSDYLSSAADNLTSVAGNTTETIMTSNIVSALMDGDTVDKSAHRLAVTVLIAIFMFISLVISIGVIVFCKKNNSVFMLQKCEQDSELEMDDINTEVETSDSEFEQIDSSHGMSKVKAETYPCLSKFVTEKTVEPEDSWTSMYARRKVKAGNQGSPSAIPLLHKSLSGTQHNSQSCAQYIEQQGVLQSKRHSDSQLLSHRYSQKITSCQSTEKQTGSNVCQSTEKQTGSNVTLQHGRLTADKLPSLAICQPTDVETEVLPLQTFTTITPPENLTSSMFSQNFTSCHPEKYQTGSLPSQVFSDCWQTDIQTGSPLKQTVTDCQLTESQTGSQSSILTEFSLTDAAFENSFLKLDTNKMSQHETSYSTNHKPAKNARSKTRPSKKSGAGRCLREDNSATSGLSNTRVVYPDSKTRAENQRTLRKQIDNFTVGNISSLTDEDDVHLRGKLEML